MRYSLVSSLALGEHVKQILPKLSLRFAELEARTKFSKDEAPPPKIKWT